MGYHSVSIGVYWSSTESDNGNAWSLNFNRADAGTSDFGYRRNGFPIRCITDSSPDPPAVLSLDKISITLKPGTSESIAINGGLENFTVSTTNSRVTKQIFMAKPCDYRRLFRHFNGECHRPSGSTARISVTVSQSAFQAPAAPTSPQVYGNN